MNFIKGAWRVLMTLKDGLALLFLLGLFFLLYLVLSSSPNPARVVDGALIINFNGQIVEQAETPDPRAALLGQNPVGGQMVLRDVVRGISAAAKDDRVKALVLDFSSFGGGGQTSLTQIAEAVGSVRKAGKPVLAYSPAYFDDAYLIAANASEIWLDPLGQTIFQGPGGAQPYFKGLADRLGVTVQVYKVGTHKAAVEPYIATQASPEAKADRQALYDGLWTNWQDHVRAARPKAQPSLNLAQSGPPTQSLAEKAQAAGLVDKIGSSIEFSKRVASVVGKDDDTRADAYKATPFDAWLAANPESSGSDKIGVVTVAGDIVDGEGSGGMAAGDTISNLILDSLKDDDLKALVVRVDSPGGSVSGSDKIRNAVLEAKAKGLPVIVSMGDVAASGGYWIATAGDQIFAEPSTITGSIGVFAVFPTFEKTLAQYGVTTDGTKTTPLSGQPDILAGTNAETDQVFQSGVEDVYRRFSALVATSRKLDVKRVDEIGQGRVWLGGPARQIGLVDRFGSLEDAIEEAAKRAKLSPADIERKYLEPKTGFWTSFFGTTRTDAIAAQPSDPVSKLAARQKAMAASALYDALHILHGPSVQVRCLTCPATKPRNDQNNVTAFVKDYLVK